MEGTGSGGNWVLLWWAEAVLNKSLVQFSADGRCCVPSLLLGLKPAYGGAMVVMATSFQKNLRHHAWFPGLLYSVALTLRQGTVDTHLRQRLLDTHRQVCFNLLWGRCFFLLHPGVHKILSVPSKSLFPQSWGSSVIKSLWPSKSSSRGILSLFARCPGWEICCEP